jgi:hypothetical protein
MKIDDKMIVAVTRALVDDGKAIEAGWVGLRLTAFSSGISQGQMGMLRDCFFAGAQHLMASITAVLDEDEEPTEDDIKRMESIDAELKAFFEDFKKRHNIME